MINKERLEHCQDANYPGVVKDKYQYPLMLPLFSKETVDLSEGYACLRVSGHGLRVSVYKHRHNREDHEQRQQKQQVSPAEIMIGN